MYSYAGQMIRVDLSDQTFKIEQLDERIMRKYLGGSSLCTGLLAKLNWQQDPFDPKMDLVLATGPITGTSAPSSARYVVAGKSPLTGTLGEAHASGYWGPELKYSGFDFIEITGRSPKLVYILIQNGKVEIRDAYRFAGMDTYQTEITLRQEFNDKKLRVLSIGIAGEKMGRMAAIINDHGRAAARGGLGAVMGSKNLKAIAVRGTKKISLAEEIKFKDYTKNLHKMISSSSAGKALRDHGTNVGMQAFYEKGDVPIKNWTKGTWEGHIENFYGPAVSEKILVKFSTCRGCPIGCGRIIEIKDGEYAGLKGKGPEYETIAGFGPLCLNSDLGAIAKANDLCNRYGLDTISTASTIAMAMECFHEGLLSKKDLDGIELYWGNHRAIIEMITKIAYKEGFGSVLAEGSLRAAKQIGSKAEEMAIQVKGLELPMHDPRGFNSWAISYPTVARGACHISAPTYWIERGMTFPDLGFPEALERHRTNLKAKWAVKFQDFCEVLESMVTCKFAVYGGLRSQHCNELIRLATGWDIDTKEMLTIGERAINIKRLINLEIGFSSKDDRLPDRVRSLSLTEGGTGGYTPENDAKIMLNEYYQERGWDENGKPTDNKLTDIEIKMES